MKQYKPKPQNIKLFAQVADGKELMDKRHGRMGLVLGVVPDISRQYGIKSQKVADGFIFTGPASKMQILAEKLHFAGVPYFEV